MEKRLLYGRAVQTPEGRIGPGETGTDPQQGLERCRGIWRLARVPAGVVFASLALTLWTRLSMLLRNRSRRCGPV